MRMRVNNREKHKRKIQKYQNFNGPNPWQNILELISPKPLSNVSCMKDIFISVAERS